jgi:hypothetical protein
MNWFLSMPIYGLFSMISVLFRSRGYPNGDLTSNSPRLTPRSSRPPGAHDPSALPVGRSAINSRRMEVFDSEFLMSFPRSSSPCELDPSWH